MTSRLVPARVAAKTEQKRDEEKEPPERRGDGRRWMESKIGMDAKVRKEEERIGGG